MKQSLLKAKMPLLMLLMLGLPLLAFSQKINFTVSGTVQDYDGNPLIGASAFVEGLAMGAVTDIDGQFAIKGEAEAGEYQLQVTYVGFTPVRRTFAISAAAPEVTLEISLADDVMDMEEVVVVGSSVTTKRKQLGNAVNVLKSDKLTVANPQGVTGALQGKLPGARITQNSGDPAGGFSVQLRGASTLLGSSEPLYVIDGVIISNNTTNVTNINAGGGASQPGTNRLADINPNDIADITVINGAAAAAQYGSRASNGVVLITTKRGKAGKPSFSYSSGFNVNELRKPVYVNLRGEQFGSADQRLYPIAGTNADGNLTVGANFSTEKVPVARYDYQDQIFDTGYGTDQHLSVRGGNEQSNYYASLSYTLNEGIIRNTDFQRYGARFRFNQSVSDWASFSIGLNYNNSFSNERPDGNVFWSPINAFNITNNIWDITQRDELGNLQSVEPTRVNPLSVIEDFDITQSVNRAISDFQLKLFPLKGLTIDYIVGVDAYNQEGNIFIPPYPYAPVNPTYFDDGYASTANNNVFLINNDINISYEKEISSSLVSITKAGFSDQYSQNAFSVAQGRGLAPFVETVNGASIILNPGANTDRLRIWGYYLQQTFGLNDRLFLTAAARVDAASSFSEDNRNIIYPKVSASYVLSSEPFWQESGLGRTISLFKLRASWGQAGNLTAIGPYARFSTYNTGNLAGSVAINQSSTLANPDVRPEVNTETEIGADVSFLKDRIGMSFTWYNQDIDDLLVSRSLAASQGGSAITTNVGSLENKGVEVLLYGSPIRKRDFSWDISLNFSRNRNRVTNLGQARTAVPNVTGAPIFLVDDQPLGVFFGTYIARDDNGDPLLTPEGFLQQERGDAATNMPQRDANGQPTGTPLQQVIGDPNPDYILGGSTTFNYKRFGITAVIESVQGQDVFDADKRTRQGVGIGEYAEQELSGELPRGWIWAMYPILEWRISDGSFTKLRELSVSYTIPDIGGVLSNTTISVGGRNLFSIDNFTSYDPETNAGGQSNLMRNVNFGNVPIPRVYTLNIRTNF
jgi:TonB-linked SusC/RagA family outer membrane protein